ncbi:MAG: metallophosphoesterase [Candidatus Hydrogenedentes bacterium]|nr:metallophosphoesterase [Candidatus Hydrogenedentota bacterium]
MRSMKLAFIVLGLALAMTAQADNFYVTPHLQNVSQDGATLIWQTEEPGPAEAEYGLEGAFDQKALNPASELIRKVRITGLQPDTSYSYRVRAGEAEYTNTFKTAPAKNPAREVTFIAFGDTRRWDTMVPETKMWDHVLQWNAEFFIINGDLVSRGHEYPLWPEHFQRFAELNGKYMIATARGNHEGSMISDVENDWFGKYHEVPGGKEPYAFMDWGNVHVVLLSWEQTMLNYVQDTAKWLDAHLATVDSPYVFVTQHFPIYCTGYESPENNRKQPGNDMMYLRRILDKHHVDAHVSGHTHIYERHFPLRENARNDREGVLYVVNGGDIGGNYPDWWTAVSDYDAPLSKPTYTVFQCKTDRMIVRTFCWSPEQKAFIQSDYVVRWQDEGIPQAAQASLSAKQGAELIAAMEELAAMIYTPAAPALLPFLKSDDAAVRQAAAKALSLLGSAEVAGDLVTYVNDKDLAVRRYAARSLECAMPESLARDVAKLASDSGQDEETRVKLIGALQFHAPKKLTRKTALNILKSDAPESVRNRAAYALTTTVEERDVRRLATMFEKEKSQYVMVRLAFTLNELTGNPQSLDDEGELYKSQPGQRSEFTKKWMAKG